MKPAAETNPQDDTRAGSGLRPAKRQWPLIAAIGLTVIGAVGLAYALATVMALPLARVTATQHQCLSAPRPSRFRTSPWRSPT